MMRDNDEKYQKLLDGLKYRPVLDDPEELKQKILLRIKHSSQDRRSVLLKKSISKTIVGAVAACIIGFWIFEVVFFTKSSGLFGEAGPIYVDLFSYSGTIAEYKSVVAGKDMKCSVPEKREIMRKILEIRDEKRAEEKIRQQFFENMFMLEL